MDKSHPLLNEYKYNPKSTFALNEGLKRHPSTIREKELFLEEDNDNISNSSTYNNLKNNNILLELLNVRKLSNLLNKVIVDDCLILILNVRYRKEINQRIFSWEIKKSYLEMKEFLHQINLEIINNQIKLENKNLELKWEVFRMIELKEYHKRNVELVAILNEIFNHPKLKNHFKILEFLEISMYSFDNLDDNEYFQKPKEGYILKRCKAGKFFSCLQALCCKNCPCCKLWQRRWFVLKEDMIFYLDNSYSNIGKDIFWFDQEIKVVKCYKNIKNSIGIINISRKLILKFEDELKMETWYQILIKKIEDYHLSLKNIYDSFANERSMCNAKWFVDAHDYFSHLYDNILIAKESIFIAGWWVSPELYLKRPVKKQELHTMRLMDILKHKAEQGVNIHILIYKEFKMAVSVNSQHTKEIFNDLHPNIKVTRHPKASFDLLWSHHEKIVIIDQIVAYTGGVDLCWGRYDYSDHRLVEEENKEEVYYWPGIDFSNSRMKDFNNLRDYVIVSIPRNCGVRMPWHDIAVYLTGPVVADLNRHFVERWNYARTIVNFRQSKTHTITYGKTIMKIVKGNRSNYNNTIKSSSQGSFYNSNTVNNLSTHKNSDDVKGGESNHSIESPDQKETNPNKLSFNNKRKTKDDRKNLPVSSDNYNEKRDSILDKMKGVFLRVKNKVKKKISSSRLALNNENSQDYLNINIKPSFIPPDNKMICQVIRSVSNWSAGLIKKDENSILKAYYDLIDNSKHYIFIENQFFISKTFSDEECYYGNSNIINEVALHIRKRIEKAFNNGEKFRVFIIIPLLPGFAGEVHETVTLQILLKYTYKTISRNKGFSLIEKLYQLMGSKVEEYIFFFSLRTHGVVNGDPYSEIIYVHSKVMIIDDEIALIGSANINDRSLLGSRDSEVGVIIKDDYKVYSKMDGKQYLASNFAQSLRIRLFKEHLGLSVENNEFPEILLDPLDEKLFKMMKDIASSNTVIYREIFNCYPDDKIQKFSDIANLSYLISHQDDLAKSLKIDRYHNYKDKIIGNLVEFPLNFLKQEYLNRKYFCKEILVPIKNFL